MPGPEVPFPLKAEPGVPFPLLPLDDDGYREAATKFGFCRDCPFPMKTDPVVKEFAKSKLHRTFGKGTYRANEIAGVVTISATGVAPNLNTIVQLVQLPLMIWPPRFALYFTEPEITLPATHPFHVEATLLTHERLETIVVQDADGIHAVPVENF